MEKSFLCSQRLEKGRSSSECHRGTYFVFSLAVNRCSLFMDPGLRTYAWRFSETETWYLLNQTLPSLAFNAAACWVSNTYTSLPGYTAYPSFGVGPFVKSEPACLKDSSGSAWAMVVSSRYILTRSNHQ